MVNNTKVIKNRIKSVKNTYKVTKSMEKISAVKRVKYSSLAMASKEFTGEIAKTNKIFASGVTLDDDSPKVLLDNGVNIELIILVCSDRGLCGSFNANIINAASNYIKEQREENKDKVFKLICIGKKGVKLSNSANMELLSLYEKLSDTPDFETISSVLSNIIVGYENGEYGQVTMITSSFQSSTVQSVIIEKLLPFSLKVSEPSEDEVNPTIYQYEPSPLALQEYILKKGLETKLYQGILESSASEHTSRMIAMKNSSDNAHELNKLLERTYNKSRQEQVTQEVSEIISGVEAISNINTF